jgi:hypothetical protein
VGGSRLARRVWPDTAAYCWPWRRQYLLERGLVAVERASTPKHSRTRSLIDCGYYALDRDGRKVDSIASKAAGHLMWSDIVPKSGPATSHSP